MGVTASVKMWKQLLLAQLLCVSLAWHVNADPPSSVRSAAPDTRFSVMPPQEFIKGVCQYLEEDLKMIPWPVRMGGICDNLGINDPTKTEKICPMVDVMKMLLGNFQSMYPMQCAPDAIRPPRSSDPSGRVLTTTTDAAIHADFLTAACVAGFLCAHMLAGTVQQLDRSANSLCVTTAATITAVSGL